MYRKYSQYDEICDECLCQTCVHNLEYHGDCRTCDAYCKDAEPKYECGAYFKSNEIKLEQINKIVL